MEIKELTFAAFGPFTDRPPLSFDRGNGRFHVIYGPNEVGKSSALRGLKALLYGIDERTPDNFVHANDRLRIGGRLYAQDGRQLTFSRRKGRKKTILDANGTALDDTALAPFLHGVSEQLFEMLFGIDHRALVQGGEDILAQRGDVGQALFSASLGSHALHAVLADLDREADELFKARGSTPRINTAIKAHNALISQIRDCSLSSRKWEDNRRALNRSSRDLHQVQDELARDRAEINRLKRVQRCLPRLAQREALQGRLEALADVIVLAADFGSRHRLASNELDKAKSIIQQTGLRIESRESELAALQVQQSVLDDAENIEALHALLGSHRKALQDKPHLEAEHKQLLANMENLINDVRPDLDPASLETLRPALTKRTRISTLGGEYPGLVSQAKAAGKNRRDTERQLKEACQALEALPAADSPAALRQAIAETRKAGDIDAQILSMRSEHDSSKARCEHDLARLSLWTGSLDALSRLEVPSQETILRIEDKYVDLARRTASLHDKQADNKNMSLETASRLDAIQRAGAVPSEQALTELRYNRDEVWQLVRRQWIDGEDVSAQASAIDAQNALPDAFELRLSETDDIADRLRREAERVHTQASLQAQKKESDQRATDIAGQIEQCDAERTQLDSEWNALWRSCTIQPLTPREMRG